jgi:hypothetical protein
MTSRSSISASIAALAAAIALTNDASAQQESTNRVAVETAWSVFVEDEPKQCWSTAPAKATVNTRDGKTVSVSRGDIGLFVTYIPSSNVTGELSFTGGYPFADGSSVTMDVGGTKFELFTDGEWAWPSSPQDDAQIVATLKRGAEAVLTARSARGTQTQDTFSLMGFTAAMDEAAKRCSG